MDSADSKLILTALEGCDCLCNCSFIIDAGHFCGAACCSCWRTAAVVREMIWDMSVLVVGELVDEMFGAGYGAVDILSKSCFICWSIWLRRC